MQAGNANAVLVLQYSSTVMLLTAGNVDTVLVLQYSSTVLLMAGNVDTVLAPYTAPDCG